MSGLGTFRFREPLLARTERKRQAWHDERHEKDRQEPLSGASERDNLALGRVEGQSAAQVSAVADLQGVMSSFDWYLDRVVHFDRPDTLTVDHDIERATTDLHSDRFVRQLESCRHLQSPFCVSRSAGPLICFHCVTRHLSGAVPRGSPSSPGRWDGLRTRLRARAYFAKRPRI